MKIFEVVLNMMLSFESDNRPDADTLIQAFEQLKGTAN